MYNNRIVQLVDDLYYKFNLSGIYEQRYNYIDTKIEKEGTYEGHIIIITLYIYIDIVRR